MKERHFIFSLSSYLIFPHNSLRLLYLVLLVPGKSWQRLDFDKGGGGTISPRNCALRRGTIRVDALPLSLYRYFTRTIPSVT